MKLGIFGGAFNPVHNGHIRLAKFFLKSLSLDKMLVIPTADPPHRCSDGFAGAEHRLKMLTLAFDGEEKIEISDIEFKREGKSYTFDTVRLLKKEYTNAKIFLVVGEDQFLSFDKWYRYCELLEEVCLCTAARNENSREAIENFAKALLGEKHSYFLADFDPVTVSSSLIREKIKTGGDVSRMLPKKVYDYIKDKGLYIE